MSYLLIDLLTDLCRRWVSWLSVPESMPWALLMSTKDPEISTLYSSTICACILFTSYCFNFCYSSCGILDSCTFKLFSIPKSIVMSRKPRDTLSRLFSIGRSLVIKNGFFFSSSSIPRSMDFSFSSILDFFSTGFISCKKRSTRSNFGSAYSSPS